MSNIPNSDLVNPAVSVSPVASVAAPISTLLADEVSSNAGRELEKSVGNFHNMRRAETITGTSQYMGRKILGNRNEGRSSIGH